MAAENKVSIDVTINTDAQKQIDKYVHSFNSLRYSVNELSQPFNSFSNTLNSLDKNISKYTDSLNKINGQTQEISATSDGAKNKLSDLSTSFSTWGTILALLKESIKGWQIALTGGLAILVAFLPEIINFAKAIFTGKDAVNQMVVNLKSLNEVMRSANKDAASETTRLQLLYKSATDVNGKYLDKLQTVQQLKKEYPNYLKNISDEDIMNGKAKKTFDMLTKSILETAKAKAAVNKMTDEATKMLDADFQIQKIKNANLNEKKRYEKEAAEGGNAKKALTFYKEESDKRARIAIAEQEEIKKTSTNSINYLTNYAGGATAIAKTFTKGNDVSIPNGKLQPVPQEPKGKGSGKTNNTYDVTNYIAQESANIFAEYNKRVNETNAYYDKLKANKKLSDKEQQDLELQHQEALNTLKNDFQKNDVEKLSDFEHKLQQIVIDSTEDTKQKATLQAEEDKKQKLQEFDKETAEIKQRIIDEQKQLAELKGKATAEDRLLLEESIKKQNETLVQAAEVRIKYEAQLTKQIETVRNAKTDKPAKDTADKEPGNDDKKTEQVTDPSLKQQLITLKAQHDAAITNTKRTQEEVKKIEEDYAKKKADLEDKLVSSKIHAGDKYIDAVLKNSKKDSAIYKAAFMAKKATSIADVIISTKKGIIGSFEGYANLPFIGQALAIAQAAIIAGQGAASIADIAKQKPGFAAGGQYTSDGRGALLPGYSRIDNTNAYLRSGEAVVVSEAMRNPWARNLVSAINVAHGGRDFSMPNTSRGYAIGGIFTDGGNANRYYNQPVNDMKDMANTLAYQMLNNFPPIYVDVKDVNNQQNILAQTVNRVNL